LKVFPYIVFMKEIWKRIPNFNKYEASNLGRIKTFNWKGSKQERVMKPAKDGSGYLRTVLIDNEGKNKTVKVHRIIASTFIDNDLNKPEVNHINAVKDDNRVVNLEWSTRQENLKHAKENNLQKVLKGSEIGNSKLKEHEVLSIRREYKPRVVTKRMLAEKYNVDWTTIKDIIQKRTWKHI
jgi:hypothetical protein